MIKLLRIVVRFCLLLLVTGTNAQSDYSNALKLNIKKVDHYLDSASKQFRFNGVALIAQKGEVLLNKGYGWRDVRSKTLHDSSSIFQIGSITKGFTATIILKLQEDGKLSVSDPIDKFIPDYPNGDKLTLYHLLTHTSGIYDYTKNLAPYKFLIKKTVSQRRIVNIMEDKPLETEPGTQFRYSSSNYYLLGIIIEKVTGKAYEQVVRETIFDPLQMEHSGFDFRNLSSPLKATGYSVFYKGRQTEANDMDSTVQYSAGGIYSTAGDLYKWIKAVSNQQILTPGSWKQALTPYKGNYGFGWAIDSLYGRRYITHTGVTANFTSLIMYFPDEAISIVLLNNTAGNLWNSGSDISQVIFDQPYPWGGQPEVRVDSAIMNQYTGTYVYDKSHTLFVIVRDGKLQLSGTRNTGLDNAPFISLSDTQFYNSRLYLKIEFVRDGSGKVTGLKSIRDGWYLSWTKVN
jgi:CubicO group peptidase (beta-lactamase class C family)